MSEDRGPGPVSTLLSGVGVVTLLVVIIVVALLILIF